MEDLVLPQRMKIVIVGPAYPLRGGIAHHTALLAQELRKRHTVDIVTFKRQYPGFLFPGSSQKESAGELLQMTTEEALDSINPFNWVHIGLMLRRRAPDLIIFTYSLPFFGPCFGTVAALARKAGRTRIMFLCHNVIPHERRPGDIVFTRFAFHFADAFLVQSEDVRRDLLRLVPGAKSALSPHPVYHLFGNAMDRGTARQQLEILHPKVILFFGYIRKYKGLNVLIEALRILVEEQHRTDILLLVVGEFYGDEESYRKSAQQLGSHVRFVSGYLPQNEVARYFSASDAVILPYLSATQSGIAQIAYNFDRPLIVTAVGGLAEVVAEGETGFVVPPGDARALARAIGRFFEEGRPEAMSARVGSEKNKYSWEHMAATIESLLE